jgi:hypothetical protein
MSQGAIYDITVEDHSNYLLSGIISANSGKSVSVASEFTSRITGIPIIGIDGKPIPNNWPVPSPDYPRIFWLIGWDTAHLGQTLHKLLFQPGMGGQFRCIRDEQTGEWRTWNRADPVDMKRLKESKLTEPLIPERLIVKDSWEWEIARGNVFKSVRLKNGAVLYAYPSSSRNPKQGDAVSGIWIDEDIQYPGHMREWQDRLTDEEGWLLWSVWPHMKNEALMELLERAELDEFSDHPQITAFQLIMTDNPYLTDTGKDQALGRMGSADEIARRNRGELLTDHLSMYQFDSDTHLIRRPIDARRKVDIPPAMELLRDIWLRTGTFPREWTRYLSIDPSHTRTACLSWVVPPIEWQGVTLGDVCICEWELIVRKWSALMLAQEVANRMGDRPYECFIMDMKVGRQTHAGRDTTACEVYSNAFRGKGLFSRLSSYSFIPGCDKPPTRFRAVRDLLTIQPTIGIPSLVFVEETCLETKREFAKYRKRTETRGENIDMMLDEPANPRLFDAMAAVEYLAVYIQQSFMMGTGYVDPSNYGPKGNAVYRHAQKLMKKRDEAEGNLGVVYLGQ